MIKKQSIIDRLNEIRSELLSLADSIRNLPPNPNVDPLSDNTFVIKMSQLAKHQNFTPFYHSFQSQYAFIAQLIEECDLNDALDKLDIIIKKGKLYRNHQLITFHPEVIENLKGLIQ